MNRTKEKQTKGDRVTFPGVPDSERVMELVRGDGGERVILSFSAGKDAIAAWIAMRDAGLKVLPYFMYIVPDLGFIERGVRYFEEYFETKILRVPHPALYRMLNEFVFQPPERCRLIEDLDLPEYDYDELRDCVADDFGVPRTTWSASGVRAADSLMRRTHFKMHGPMNHNRRVFYPVWDWKKAELVERIRAERIQMPVDYQLFGRSFDGIDFRFLYPIKQHFPEDYAKILEWFPLAELEIKRYEYAQSRT
jgi:hypothetical protein